VRPAAPQKVKPNTTAQQQAREMHLYLLALELVSHGTCQSWSGPTGHGEREAVLPPGDGKPRYLELREHFRTARDWYEREDLLDQARTEVGQLRRTAPLTIVGETRDQLIQRMHQEAVDLTPQQVASTKQFGMFTAREVTSLRMKADRDPDTGRPRSATKPDDWQAKAGEMRDQGYSLNAIVFKLRVRRADVLAWDRDRQAA